MTLAIGGAPVYRVGMLLLGSVSAAFGCAGFVHAEGLSAESDQAEVLYELDPGGVRATYALTYEGDAADFGWIVPAPTAPTAAVDGDPTRIDALRDLSAPEVVWPPGEHHGAAAPA